MSLCAIKNNLVKSSQTVYIYIAVPCHFNVSTWWRPIFLRFYWPEKLKRTFFFSFGNAFIVTTAYIYMVWRWVKSRNEMIYSISLVCLVWFSFRSDCIHRVHTECRWWPRAKGAPLKTFDSSDSWHSLSLFFFFNCYECISVCEYLFVSGRTLAGFTEFLLSLWHKSDLFWCPTTWTRFTSAKSSGVSCFFVHFRYMW